LHVWRQIDPLGSAIESTMQIASAGQTMAEL